jgi:hypothetical protein
VVKEHPDERPALPCTAKDKVATIKAQKGMSQETWMDHIES